MPESVLVLMFVLALGAFVVACLGINVLRRQLRIARGRVVRATRAVDDPDLWAAGHGHHLAEVRRALTLDEGQR